MAASFQFGRTVSTSNAMRTLDQASVLDALRRHASGDWGDIGREDWESNEQALKHGARLLSSYCDANGTKFWIITEADRSATTVLLPEDY